MFSRRSSQWLVRHRRVFLRGEDRAAGVLAVVHGGVGGPLQCVQVGGADAVRGGGADRGGGVDQAAVADVDGLGERGGGLVQAQAAPRGADPHGESELFSEQWRFGSGRALPLVAPGPGTGPGACQYIHPIPRGRLPSSGMRTG
ncbi:uncharacterized protein SAZU_3095 [Streptomyces azureus]|uniref:Uncharacterized protein n=1 Tax=Streptomyces azureus TaxID=146537 RepID=A0A0K8PKI0_STRAJ|nr:uncharacterized protein SAZU_3095 [Streptomyces azureus]